MEPRRYEPGHIHFVKAITSPENEGSVAFHQRMGFTEMTLAPGLRWKRPGAYHHARHLAT